MPRVATLTDTQIKNAKPRDKEYNLPAGQGLQVKVKPNGSKLFFAKNNNRGSGMATHHIPEAERFPTRLAGN